MDYVIYDGLPPLGIIELFNGFLCAVLAVNCPATKISTPPIRMENLPRNSVKYRPLLVDALGNKIDFLNVLAAQFEQEASWRCDLSSRFANGCAQFTPDTAKWASKTFCRDLGNPNTSEPEWAYTCGVRYMLWLHKRVATYRTECDRWAFALMGYNGGLGNVRKQQAATAKAGKDAGSFQDVKRFKVRAQWAHDENMDYVERILGSRITKYNENNYGVTVSCQDTI